ncbi:iron permease [Ramaria rubella]|nr:iron permease [Ramaria rubella]
MSSPTTLTESYELEKPAATVTVKVPKNAAFWFSYIAALVSLFLSALDLASVATALPTITKDLNGGDEFTWIGSAYVLSSTAFIPLSGSFADLFGRRPVMLGSIAFFTLGSALCGSAQNINWLIAARTIQGVGGGGIINLTEIIVSDIVPLAERGAYQGILVLVWCFAAAIGPPIGGALAGAGSWRWIFYLNLPLTGIAFVLVLFFLRVKTPPGKTLEKLARVDWIGNFIVIAGITLSNVGLAFAGIRFPWGSVTVLAPLIIGMVLIGLFIVYEKYVAKEPTIPWVVVANRTSLFAYLGTFVHGITSVTLFYYLPVYFQSVLEASPIMSGVDYLATAFVTAPFALFCGIAVQIMGRYLPANYVGWVLTIVGFGLLSLLEVNSSRGHWVGFQIIAAAGTGIIYAGTIFPTLAPLSVDLNAAALAFFAFVRAFAQTWGITIGATILQNQLKIRLPADFAAQFPAGAEIAYAAIPSIPTLEEPLRTQVKEAFAGSLSIVWKSMIGIAGLGLITSLFMREVAMHEEVNADYALEEKLNTSGGQNGQLESA